MPTEPNPDVLLAAADKHLGLIAKYNPYRNFAGIKDRKAFAALIANDPAFCSFGFGDDRYVVGRIGGNLIRVQLISQRGFYAASVKGNG